jgi:hypothetical protein
MERLLAAYVLVLVLLAASPALPLRSFGASASQGDSAQLALAASTNATVVGGPVTFNGTAFGLNATSVTYVVIRPDGSSYNGSASVSSSAFSFEVTFDGAGDWTVFCFVGDSSNPQAVSGLVGISVAEEPPSYMGIPVHWLGVAILAISAVSLVYLVYAIRKRAEEEKRNEAAKGKAGTP